MTLFRPNPALSIPAIALLSGCIGSLGDGAAGPRGQMRDPGGPTRPPACEDAPREAEVPMRRLTPREHQETLRAMFGDAAPEVIDLLPAPSTGYAYSTFAAAHRVGETEARALLEAAEETAIAVEPTLPDCAGIAIAECARATIAPWATVAYRRPPESEEVERLVALAVAASGDGLPPREALAVALIALLQEPRFLYVVESRADTETWSLDAHERAQRLAYTYLGAPPDDVLREAAESGLLTTPEGMREEGARITADPRARATFQRFVREWLGIATLPTSHSAEVRAALDEELRRLVDEAWDADDGFATLLTSDVAHVDAVLEEFYGLPRESSGPGDFRRVTMPGTRVGVLTHPLVLAAASHGEQSSPILRGKLIRTRLLCTNMPPPPVDAQESEPSLPATATARERYEARIASSRCMGCHTLLDPVGFGLEAYDGLGRFRSELGGRAIDDVGEIAAGGDASGTFDGASELFALLVASDDASRCFAQQWTEYALGREVRADLTCSVGDLGDAFVGSGRAMPVLFESLATHPSFVERRAQEVSP
ncbi:DUF1588 domain-containing protein [Sandaracinus amylolyticus]|uniref:Cellulose-binding domain protein n=1 Tax=Sandaracinus amylolyticus TaxID=927083 RepID=A0A0F6YN65_9BACT|nr:DUF1588 domain-containing protein [Sandaracinus amylolyticus]AKF10947.1 Cellulose-binding domain protein [Sandaracinus amylolyticus]